MKSSKYGLLIVLISLILFLSLNAVNANNDTELINKDIKTMNNNDNSVKILNNEAFNDLSYIYVKISSTSSTESGTQDNPYKSISSAVSNSPNGNNIYIANGEYVEAEKISLNKDIFFVGESKNNVIIKTSFNNALFECIEDNVQLNFSNLTFSDIKTGSTSIIKIGGNQNVIIDNCNFNNFSGKYGAIQLYTTATGNINNCNFDGSISTTVGAGIYLSGAGKYNIINFNFENIKYTGASGYMYGIIYSYGTNSITNILNSTFFKMCRICQLNYLHQIKIIFN